MSSVIGRLVLTSANGCPHRHRVPDGVGREQRDSVSHLQAIVSNQRGAQTCGFILDLEEVKPLFGDGIDIATNATTSIGNGRRIFCRLEDPLPCCHIGRDYSEVSPDMYTVFSPRADMALTVKLRMWALPAHCRSFWFVTGPGS